MRLRIREIVVDSSLQIRDGLDEATIERYADCFDRLPPVVVFDTSEGYLLADGFHRVAAAQRLGLADVEADARPGTRTDAADHAATANTTWGKPLTPAERRRAILGLHERHPEWAQRRIADLMGVSQPAVANVLGSQRVAQTAGVITSYHPNGTALGQKHLVAIGHAPLAQQPRLAQAAASEGWTVEQTREQVRSLPEDVLSVPPPMDLHRPDGAASSPGVITLREWDEMHPDLQLTVVSDWEMAGTGTPTLNKQNTDHIEWAQWSWNPVTGCLHNCSYCYARDIAVRFYPHGFVPAFLPHRLGAPAATRVPAEAATNVAYKNVFTCSMADLFGKWVPRQWIEAVLEVVRDNPQWNFLFLTKFPIRLSEFEFPDNAWLGTSVDAQARIPNAEKAFARVQGGVKWLSCEPMLERLTFSRLDLFDWVVIGGASSSTQTPEFRPPREWVTHLERQAEAAGCKVYEKTNLLERRREYPGAPEPAQVVVPDAFKMGYLQRDVAPAAASGGGT